MKCWGRKRKGSSWRGKGSGGEEEERGVIGGK